MERFQKIKNARKKLNVSTLCRCCGLESDERFNIIQIFEDGVEFKEKMSSMIGIHVCSDGMPQSICAICYDKINDFYEFRLMSLNTEKQTREALGLPLQPLPQKPNIPKQLEERKPVVKLVDLKYSIQDKVLIRKAFERISNKSSAKERRSETPPAVPPPPAKKLRKDFKCIVCSEYFAYINDLQDHQFKEHLATISKYACGSCRETFEQLSDFKSHESYHTKEKMPFECFSCLCSFVKMKDFIKHTSNYNCSEKKLLPVLIQDIKCFQCRKKFLTQNLYEWHGCFIKTRGTCSKCGTYFAKKKALFKHYVLCDGKLMNSATDPNRIKMESISPAAKVQQDGKKKPGRPLGTKMTKKKPMPARKMTIVKSEQELIVPMITEADVDDDIDDYNDDNITYDNYGSDDEEGSSEFSQNIMNIEPVVELNQHENSNEIHRIIDIKKENISDDFSTLRSGHLTVDHILKIKREQIAKQQAIKISNVKNPFAVRVKQEVENGNQSAVKVLNPFSNAAANKKKVFKFPQGLRMKIKKEKNHKISVVQIKTENDSTIDEADADSEEEAQMQQMATSVVKMEKVESTKSIVKQFINPMAIAMRKKSNGNTEINSLVITSVSSISEEAAVIDNSEKNNEEEATDQITSTHPAHDEKMMTEIPAEFNKSTGEEELQQLEQPSIEDTNTFLPSLIAVNNQIDDVVMNNSNDELEELLEKYGSSDIQDDDIQDLLKFD